MILNKKYKFTPKKSVALVTGASSPLGEAICFKLANQGMNLALHYDKSRIRILNLQNKLKNVGTETIILKTDFQKSLNFKLMVSEIIKKWGRLDVVINNASRFQPSPLINKSWKKWFELYQINTLTPCSLALEAFSWLRKTKGVVINICDIYGDLPILKNYAAYSLSKAGLLFLTKYLALEFSPHVRVNAVSPGVITFPKNYKIKQKNDLIRKSALRRQGNPEEIADAVLFLAKNRFVNGQILKVDGGRFSH